jgi:hypothetical protein
MFKILALLFKLIAPYSTNRTATFNMTNQIIYNIFPKMGVYINTNYNALAYTSIP